MARPLSFADGVSLDRAVRVRRDQRVSSLGTEMRDIHHGSRIICRYDQHVAAGQRLQAFAGFEDGQGAQKPHGIKFMNIIHTCADRWDVTDCPQTCDRTTRDVGVKDR